MVQLLSYVLFLSHNYNKFMDTKPLGHIQISTVIFKVVKVKYNLNIILYKFEYSEK